MENHGNRNRGNRGMPVKWLVSPDRFLYYWERFYYVFIFYYLEIPLYMQIRSISMYTFKASNSFCPYIIWFSVPKVIKCDLYLNYKQSFWKLLHCIPWHQFDSAFDPLGNQPKVVYWDYIFYFFLTIFILPFLLNWVIKSTLS